MDEQLLRLLEGQARIEAKLDSSLASVADHEARLRPIEHWRSRVMGVYLATSIAAGLVASVAGYLLSWVPAALAAIKAQ